MKHYLVTFVERHYRTMQIEANDEDEAQSSAIASGIMTQNHPDIVTEFYVEIYK